MNDIKTTGCFTFMVICGKIVYCDACNCDYIYVANTEKTINYLKNESVCEEGIEEIGVYEWNCDDEQWKLIHGFCYSDKLMQYLHNNTPKDSNTSKDNTHKILFSEINTTLIVNDEIQNIIQKLTDCGIIKMKWTTVNETKEISLI